MCLLASISSLLLPLDLSKLPRCHNLVILIGRFFLRVGFLVGLLVGSLGLAILLGLFVRVSVPAILDINIAGSSSLPVVLDITLQGSLCLCGRGFLRLPLLGRPLLGRLRFLLGLLPRALFSLS